MLFSYGKIEFWDMAAGCGEYYCSHLVSLLCHGSHSAAAFARHVVMPSSDGHLPAHLPLWTAEPWSLPSLDMVAELGREHLLQLLHHLLL